MRILFVDNNSKYKTKLINLLTEFAGPEMDSVDYQKLDGIDPTQYSLIILSGGHDKPVEGHIDKEYKQEVKLIKEVDIPIIGVCLGCELIAQAYDCTLRKKEESHGIFTITPIAVNPIFDNLTTLEVYESHKWHITKLSDEVEALALSPRGYEIIKHKTKPIYGFQFHPEMMVNETQGDELFHNTLELINSSLL